MKTVSMLLTILVLIAVMGDTGLAQQTSSASQIVTFGVRRSSLAVLRSVSLVQGATSSPDSSLASSLQNVLSLDQHSVAVAALSIPPGYDASMTQSSTPNVESDVRPILISKKTSSVATITD